MGKLFSIFSKKTKELTCNEEVGILDIRNNYIYTRDGNVIAGLKIYSINTQLLTEREKQNLINELSAELSSEQGEMKYFNIARAVDISPLQEYLNEIRVKFIDTHFILAETFWRNKKVSQMSSSEFYSSMEFIDKKDFMEDYIEAGYFQNLN